MHHKQILLCAMCTCSTCCSKLQRVSFPQISRVSTNHIQHTTYPDICKDHVSSYNGMFMSPGSWIRYVMCRAIGCLYMHVCTHVNIIETRQHKPTSPKDSFFFLDNRMSYLRWDTSTNLSHQGSSAGQAKSSSISLVCYVGWPSLLHSFLSLPPSLSSF